MPTASSQPEAKARQRIDCLMEASGWAVQDRSAINLTAASGVAVRELPTASGEADYGLFLGKELVGVVEAKKVVSTLGGVEAQTLAYASETLPGVQVPIQPLPFLYESSVVETYFTNGLDPDPTARRVFTSHRPEPLGECLRAEVLRQAGKPDAPLAATVKGRMQLDQQLNPADMWPSQIRAVEKLEASIRDGRHRALIHMATGGGKTFTAISTDYRLITQGGARWVTIAGEDHGALAGLASTGAPVKVKGGEVTMLNQSRMRMKLELLDQHRQSPTVEIIAVN
ncbi:MAG: hypothetical protein ER33_08945 [Cyanobium sp. CACIAM 14]|nr:MAG: hypothetical protein ER33_08945 [Cyanobium sp. CACIAM 14]